MTRLGCRTKDQLDLLLEALGDVEIDRIDDRIAEVDADLHVVVAAAKYIGLPMEDLHSARDVRRGR